MRFIGTFIFEYQIKTFKSEERKWRLLPFKKQMKALKNEKENKWRNFIKFEPETKNCLIFSNIYYSSFKNSVFLKFLSGC